MSIEQAAKAEEKVSTIIEIGGKQRQLRYDLKALKRLEKLTGASALSFVDMVQNPTAERFSHLLHQGLLHETKDLTLDEVEAWVPNLGVAAKIMPSIVLAYLDGLPKDEEAADPEKKT